jgi:hypothetical protein
MYGDSDRQVQLAVTGTLGAELKEILAGTVEFLHPVIVHVGDPEIAIIIEGKIDRPIELTIAAAGRAKLEQIAAGAIEHLNAVVVAIRHPDAARAVEGKRPREVKLPVTAARRAKLANNIAVAVELHDRIAEDARDPGIATGIKSYAGRAVESTFLEQLGARGLEFRNASGIGIEVIDVGHPHISIWRLAAHVRLGESAPHAEVTAAAAEFLHSRIGIVRNHKISALVNSHRPRRVGELPIGIAFGTELKEILAGCIERLNPIVLGINDINRLQIAGTR